jgi:trigger factor
VSQTNLDVSLESSQGLERRMTVRVPSQAIEHEVNARLKKVGKTAKLKGFRPGKIPERVVRQRYAGQVRQEVLSDLIRSSYSQAISQQQLHPAGGPAIEPLSGQDAEHFSYRAVFEVYPEVTLSSVHALKFDVPVVTVGDDDVDAMIEKLREQRADWATVERPAADGDRVVIDFTGTIKDEPFDGGNGTEVPIIVGGSQVIADFDAGLKGVAADDDKSIKVKFPKDYGVADLAGMKAEFAVHVHRVEERVLPTIDEEFMAAFGIAGGDREGFVADVKKNMERELAERVRAETKTKALAALHDANRIDVPRALVAQEAQTLQTEMMQRMGTVGNPNAPSADQFDPLAEKRVRLGLLVQELVAAAKIEVDRDRVDRRVSELSAPYEDPDQAAQYYRGNRELMSQVETAVLEEQAVEYLVAQGKVSEKKFSFNEFMNNDGT